MTDQQQPDPCRQPGQYPDPYPPHVRQSHGRQSGPYDAYDTYGGHGGHGAYDAVPPPQTAATPTTDTGTTMGTTATTTTAATAVSGATAPGTAPRRTGDPIIAPGLLPAALTTALAVLLAATAQLSRPALAAGVVLLQAVTAAGWYRLNGMWPARQGIALAFLAGVTADAVLLTTGVEHAPAVVLGTLGVWCALVLVLQLRNHSSPDERLYALTAGVASTALTVIATGLLAAEPDAVTVGALTVAAAALTRALPLPSAVSLGLAVLAATGAGIAAGRLTSLGTPGAALGLAAGVCALIGLRVASYDFPSRFVHMTAGVALPLTAAVPAVYLLGRALG